eukprot:TRINITY_DN40452_c0_g1_i1.p1 TRINITY_DN40452_c0_g1~~TRINITY_DN40452_c0_g1_i1.p1  ORF type:complete len:217 (+),score=26.33 TRINITY_DN40452_c0_g1_i1:116-766(+)
MGAAALVRMRVFRPALGAKSSSSVVTSFHQEEQAVERALTSVMPCDTNISGRALSPPRLQKEQIDTSPVPGQCNLEFSEVTGHVSGRQLAPPSHGDACARPAGFALMASDAVGNAAPEEYHTESDSEQTRSHHEKKEDMSSPAWNETAITATIMDAISSFFEDLNDDASSVASSFSENSSWCSDLSGGSYTALLERSPCFVRIDTLGSLQNVLRRK